MLGKEGIWSFRTGTNVSDFMEHAAAEQKHLEMYPSSALL